MSSRKVIHKEALNIDDEEATLLSYDVVFRRPEIEEQIEEEKQQEKQQEIQQALNAQQQEFENQLSVAKQQAAQQGYEKGFQDGRQEAENIINSSLDTFKESLTELDQQVHHTLQALEPGIASLVFDIAEKIVQVPVKNDALTDIVEQEIQQILRTLQEELRIEIYVSQHDEPAIRKLVNQIDTKQIEVIADSSMNPGEYAVETPRETVVRHFKKMLNDLRKELDIKNWLNLKDPH